MSASCRTSGAWHSHEMMRRATRSGRPGAAPAAQQGTRGRKGWGGIGGWEAFQLEDAAAVIADGDDELGAAGFDGAQNEGCAVHGSGA